MLSEQDKSDMLDEKEAPESSQHNYYCVKTALGEVKLVIDVIEENKTEFEICRDDAVLRAALQLGRAEPLICLLEEWLGLPLDFSLGTQTKPELIRLTVNLSLTLSEKEGDVVNAVLSLPLTSLNRLSPPSPELAVLMCWDTLPCQLELANVALSFRQFSRLEVNGMVLIPVSFEIFWRCQVRIMGATATVFLAELDASQQRLIFDLFASDDKPAVDEVQDSGINKGAIKRISIMLHYTLPIAIDRLLGWTEQPIFVLGQSLSGFKVTLHRFQQCLAEGDLVPVGKGYGVLLRSVIYEPALIIKK